MTTRVDADRKEAPIDDAGGQDRELSAMNQLQTQLHQVLRREVTPQTLASAWNVPVERLAIYAQFVASHVRTVLDKIFPQLATQLAVVWPAIAADYLKQHPPIHYELNEAGRAFPSYLRAHADRWHVQASQLELAEVEWLDWDVYRSEAADVPSLPLAASLAGCGQVLVANATLILVELSQPLAAYRDPASHGSVVRAVDDVDLFALALAARAIPLAEAAQAAARSDGEVHAIIAEAVARGIVSVVAEVETTDECTPHTPAARHPSG